MNKSFLVMLVIAVVMVLPGVNAGIKVVEHSPYTEPENFYIWNTDAKTWEPYVLIDESSTKNGQQYAVLLRNRYSYTKYEFHDDPVGVRLFNETTQVVSSSWWTVQYWDAKKEVWNDYAVTDTTLTVQEEKELDSAAKTDEKRNKGTVTVTRDSLLASSPVTTLRDSYRLGLEKGRMQHKCSVEYTPPGEGEFRLVWHLTGLPHHPIENRSFENYYLRAGDVILDWNDMAGMTSHADVQGSSGKVDVYTKPFKDRVLIDPILTVTNPAGYYNVTWYDEGNRKNTIRFRTDLKDGPDRWWMDLNADGDFSDTNEGNFFDVVADGKDAWQQDIGLTNYIQDLEPNTAAYGLSMDQDSRSCTLDRNGSLQFAITYQVNGSESHVGDTSKDDVNTTRQYIITSGKNQVEVSTYMAFLTDGAWTDRIYIPMYLKGEETAIDSIAIQNGTYKEHKVNGAYDQIDYDPAWWAHIYNNNTPQRGMGVHCSNPYKARVNNSYARRMKGGESGFADADVIWVRFEGYPETTEDQVNQTWWFTFDLVANATPWVKAEDNFNVSSDFCTENLTITNGGSVTAEYANGNFAVINATGETSKSFTLAITDVDFTHTNYTLVIHTDDTGIAAGDVTVSGTPGIDQGPQIDAEAKPGDTIVLTLASFNADLSSPTVDWSGNSDPSVNNPNDITYVEGVSGNVIPWNVTDAEQSSGNYSIYRNSTWVVNGNWTNATAIDYDVDGLAVGTYNFSIQATDNQGGANATDAVLVTVTDDADPVNPSTIDPQWSTRAPPTSQLIVVDGITDAEDGESGVTPTISIKDDIYGWGDARVVNDSLTWDSTNSYWTYTWEVPSGVASYMDVQIYTVDSLGQSDLDVYDKSFRVAEESTFLPSGSVERVVDEGQEALTGVREWSSDNPDLAVWVMWGLFIGAGVILIAARRDGGKKPVKIIHGE